MTSNEIWEMALFYHADDSYGLTYTSFRPIVPLCMGFLKRLDISGLALVVEMFKFLTLLPLLAAINAFMDTGEKRRKS